MSLAILQENFKEIVFLNKGFMKKFNSKNNMDAMLNLQNMIVSFSKNGK